MSISIINSYMYTYTPSNICVIHAEKHHFKTTNTNYSYSKNSLILFQIPDQIQIIIQHPASISIQIVQLNWHVNRILNSVLNGAEPLVRIDMLKYVWNDSSESGSWCNIWLKYYDKYSDY